MTSTAATGAVAEPSAGRVRGTVRDGVATYLGVPYGLPPIGPRRFRGPAPVEPWSGVRDATRPGPAAPQGGSQLANLLGPDPSPQSEDCLTLNVYAPERAETDLPVLFWIHGGGFRSGRAGGPRQAAQQLARRGPMVVVTMNYRLGPLGCLYLAELANEREELGSGNFALLDMAAALTWVARSIAAFGGDPDRITVGGHSAGGACAAALAVEPPAGVRIRRLVLQSPALTDLATTAQATDSARAHLDALGIGVGEIRRLRDVSPASLLRAAAGLPEPLRSAPQLVIGGAGLPHAPLDPAADLPAELELLTGTTADEARAFLPPSADPATVADLTAAFFTRPLDLLGERATANGGTVFRYRFDWCPPDRGDGLGACHGVDVPFLLGDAEAWASAPALAEVPVAETDALRAAFGAAVARFVVTGRPADGWQPWTSASPTTHRYDTDSTVGSAL
jgi:para-nitrobenzyl esterase